jgi:hypothetical protein
MISTGLGVMHGQAVIAATRVPVSVILDSPGGVRTVAATVRRWRAKNCSRYRSQGEVQARREPARLVCPSLTSAGHDVDTVTDEDLVGAPNRDVDTAATAAERIRRARSTAWP